MVNISSKAVRVEGRGNVVYIVIHTLWMDKYVNDCHDLPTIIVPSNCDDEHW